MRRSRSPSHSVPPSDVSSAGSVAGSAKDEGAGDYCLVEGTLSLKQIRECDLSIEEAADPSNLAMLLQSLELVGWTISQWHTIKRDRPKKNPLAQFRRKVRRVRVQEQEEPAVTFQEPAQLVEPASVSAEASATGTEAAQTSSEEPLSAPLASETASSAAEDSEL